MRRRTESVIKVLRAAPHFAASIIRSSSARRAWTNNALKEISYTHAGLRSIGRPQIFEIETTNACPYTCIMCPRTYAMTRPVGHMDISLFRRILDQVDPADQMDHIRAKPTVRLLHYGEPMVYQHFAESIEYSHRRGFHVYISTNPSVWTERRIEETLDLGVDEMWVMMDGMDDETSISIRGRAAGFARGEQNLRELAKRKVHRGLTRPHITVAMIKQPKNSHQWIQFEHHWKNILGIDATYLAHYSTFDGGVKEINAIGQAFAMQNKDQAWQVVRQQKISQYPCYYPWHSVSITWDGRVVPCCRDFDASMILGDLNHQSLRQIWNGHAMQRLRRNFTRGRLMGPPCETCKEASLEIGLPGRHYVPARWMRSAAIGRMHRAVERAGDAHLGAQNLNRPEYRKSKSQESEAAELVNS